jgi:hypothetical protein
VTDQPMDVRDYLIRQQQQERIAQQFDALFTKDEDHAAAATQGIENLAYHEAQEAAAAYDYVQESLTDVITQARDLRTKIQSGTVAEKDAEAARRPAQAVRRAGRQDRSDQEQPRQRAGHPEGPRRQEGGADQQVPGPTQVVDHGR